VLSRDGSTMAVGAKVADYVRVYRHNGSGWSQIGQTSTGDGGQFGRCLDLNADGSMLVVGAWNNDNEGGRMAGQAKVYRFDGDSWEKVGQSLRGDDDDDKFGWYVSMADDGNTIAVSARLASRSSWRRRCWHCQSVYIEWKSMVATGF